MADRDKRTRKPLLDLKTLIDRPFFTVDGERYELCSPGELSVLDLERISLLGNRLNELTTAPGIEEEDDTELSDILKRLLKRIVVDLPADIEARLSEGQKLDVIEVFTQLLVKGQTGTGEVMNRSIGG